MSCAVAAQIAALYTAGDVVGLSALCIELAIEHERLVGRLGTVPVRGKQLGASSPLRREVWARDGGRCVLCRISVRRQKINRYDSGRDLGEIDHIIPVCLGGKNTLDNLRLLCLGCNRRKGKRHPSEVVA